MRDLLISLTCILISISTFLNAISIISVKDNLKDIRENKVTLICDNYVYKQNLNQALAKNCYVVKGGESDGI